VSPSASPAPAADGDRANDANGSGGSAEPGSAEWRRRLAQAVAVVVGSDAVELAPASGGAGNAAFLVIDSASGRSDPVAFVRAESGSALAGATLSLAVEARLMGAAASRGLPVPEVLAFIEEPPAIVTRVVPGTAQPSAADVEAVGAEYMGLIAELHRAPIEAFPFPAIAIATVTDAIRADLGRFQQWARSAGVDDVPLLRLAWRVLEATMPQTEDKPRVLHGDVGAGNFMVHDGHVSAILDWELSHLGDYHEDLAWMWMRGAHTAFGDPARRLAEYSTASGRPVDRQRVQWHLVSVMWKSLVAMQANLDSTEPTPRTLLHYVVQLTYDALLCSAMGRVLDRPVPVGIAEPVRRATPQSLLAARVLATTDPDRQAQVALGHLRDKAAQAAWEAEQLTADARRLLGVAADELAGLIDDADRDRLARLVEVYGRAADRSASAMPRAVRQIRQARQIGLCD
jgi:aminoglycoside phosphotransferase (APT) family kinase protein